MSSPCHVFLMVLGSACLLASVQMTEAYMTLDQLAEKQESYLADALLRDLASRMAFSDASSYVDYQPPALMPVRANKDFEQFDYDTILEERANPSIRDQERFPYANLQTAWGDQLISGGTGKIQEPQVVKTDAVLPAYCNPPNPCPVGYTEAQGCISDFENTAAFSREYQQQPNCMCDHEHMLSCSRTPANSRAARFFGMQEDKRKPANPFLDGEKLPIAAKKGSDVTNF